jgi:hypothetical protein
MPIRNVLKDLIGRKKSLEKISTDDLRREKIALEQQEVKFQRQVENLEKQKADVFAQGVREASDRKKVMFARKVKDLDSQARSVDTNCSFINRQLRIINGFLQLKENEALVRNYGLSGVISKMDLAKLQTYIEKATVNRAFSMDRFAQIMGRLEESEGLVGEVGEDPDIREIVDAMTEASNAEKGDPERAVEKGLQVVDGILHKEPESSEV